MEVIVNLALWIIAGVLAFAFAGSGIMKLVQSKDKLVASPTGGWAADWSPASIKLVGVAEILGAIGLILVMIGAAVVHSRRHELPNVAINVVLLLLAAFVAWGRFGPLPFSA
jgi:hypothetical protein